MTKIGTYLVGTLLFWAPGANAVAENVAPTQKAHSALKTERNSSWQPPQFEVLPQTEVLVHTEVSVENVADLVEQISEKSASEGVPLYAYEISHQPILDFSDMAKPNPIHISPQEIAARSDSPYAFSIANVGKVQAQLIDMLKKPHSLRWSFTLVRGVLTGATLYYAIVASNTVPSEVAINTAVILGTTSGLIQYYGDAYLRWLNRKGLTHQVLSRPLTALSTAAHQAIGLPNMPMPEVESLQSKIVSTQLTQHGQIVLKWVATEILFIGLYAQLLSAAGYPLHDSMADALKYVVMTSLMAFPGQGLADSANATAAQNRRATSVRDIGGERAFLAYQEFSEKAGGQKFDAFLKFYNFMHSEHPLTPQQIKQMRSLDERHGMYSAFLLMAVSAATNVFAVWRSFQDLTLKNWLPIDVDTILPQWLSNLNLGDAGLFGLGIMGGAFYIKSTLDRNALAKETQRLQNESDLAPSQRQEANFLSQIKNWLRRSSCYRVTSSQSKRSD